MRKLKDFTKNRFNYFYAEAGEMEAEKLLMHINLGIDLVEDKYLEAVKSAALRLYRLVKLKGDRNLTERQAKCLRMAYATIQTGLLFEEEELQYD